MHYTFFIRGFQLLGGLIMESATNTEASLILESGAIPQIFNSVMERTTKKKVTLSQWHKNGIIVQ